MTDTTFSQQKVPLGIGTILGDTFLILLKRIVPLFIIGLIPSVIIFAMFTGTLGMRGLLGLDQVQPSVLMGAAYWITVIANYVVYFATAAFLVQLIYDAKLNRPARLASYVASTVSSIIPVALLGIVVTLLFFVGAMFLVLPGFWIYAVFSVTVPAIVIERAGFGGMKRSAQLTKGYRWPIVVVIFIVTVCSIIFSMGAQFLAKLVGTNIGLIPAIALYLVGSSFGVIVGTLSFALIYARLREIKEGVSVNQIAAVFD